MTESVYERVLGSELDRLPAQLRAYFVGGGRIGTGVGTFEIAGSRIRALRPLLAVLAQHRILFPEYAQNVPLEIVNTPTSDGGLGAVRTFHLPGRDRALEDTMRVVDGHLHDFMGRRRGFEVRLALTVNDDVLRMRSDRQWVRLGKVRIRLPMVATVYVTESWVEVSQHVDVSLRSPLLGEWFSYKGTFTYQHG